jgi:glycosyltransferase involved in cell wall biosynthesis
MSLATAKDPVLKSVPELATDDPPVVLDARVVSGSGGGPDKTILNSPRFLKSAGYRMLCAYMHPPSDPGFEVLRQKAESWGAPLLSIPDRGPWDWRVITRLLEICRKENVSIWHGHDYKSNAIGLLLQRFWPMRLVTTVHGWVKQTHRTPLYYSVDRFCLRHYERVLCVSEDLRERCLKCGVPEDHCLLIDNAIDIQQYVRSLTPKVAKQRLGVPPDRLLVGAVGRLSEEKGFDLLIQAVDQLITSGLDLELLIAGDGDRQAELESLIQRLGRKDRIRLLGYQTDLIPFYQAMDIFTLSSLREGLPNVLLEAMAMGIPVVSTKVAGIPRLVTDGESGLLVEPGSIKALADAITRLAADEGLRTILGRGGHEVIETRFSFESRMQKIGALYDELVAPPAQTMRSESTMP